MTALAAAYEAKKKIAQRELYQMGAVKIWKGALVSIRTDGYLYPARSGTSTDIFVGVAYESKDNSAGVAGALSMLVEKSGSFVYGKAAAAITDIGTAFYASDDNNVTATSTNNQLVGYATYLESTTTLRIRIDRAVQ